MVNIKVLIQRCPPLRKLRDLLLWMRGGSENPEIWEGDRRWLREITYSRSSTNEKDWAQTGHRWVESWILPAIASYQKPSWHVLEIGCGPGRILVPMASRFDRVTGIDFSADMVQYAKHRLQSYSNVDVIQNDGATIPLPSASIDFVYSVIAFQHMNLDTITAYFREAYRVLRPGGVFRFQTRRDVERRNVSLLDRYFLSKEEVDKLAVAHGFDIISYEQGLGHPTWHWFTLRKPR
ncbi:MAG: class I SAM-dependent methyltransferase [Promethearchaeota archaeon]